MNRVQTVSIGSAVPDKFEDLSTFIAILDAGGINAAANRLGIAKSAVSRRLSDLERRLGASLVNRTSRRFEPTIVGTEYARRARAVLAALEELDASVGPSQSAEVVTIVADGSIIAHKIVPALAHLDESTRCIMLRLLDSRLPDSAGQADIHVSVEPTVRDARVLFTFSVLPCCAPSYLSEPKAANDRSVSDTHRLIGLDGVFPPPFIALSDLDAAAAAAIAGLGLARLPDYVLATAVADGKLLMVPEQPRASSIPVFAWCNAGAAPSAQRLLDALFTIINRDESRHPTVRF